MPGSDAPKPLRLNPGDLRIVRGIDRQKTCRQERLARGKPLQFERCGSDLPRTAPQWLSGFNSNHTLTRNAGGGCPTGRPWHSLPSCSSERFPTRACALAYIGTRRSPLSGSPRLAVNPPNAILNYLYAVLESEARLAAAALGLDPGLGVLHKDTPNRDSLACDLMEPVRPQVDAFLLDWISRGPLRREWFFEQRDGNCRPHGKPSPPGFRDCTKLGSCYRANC